jgi:hypothetical protein
MRKLLAPFCFLAACCPALAQPETVAVEHQRNLSGLWRISVPAGFGVSLGGPAHFGPMRDLYCRITQAGDIHCLSGGYPRSGAAALDGDKVHIAWGTMMARMAIDALYQDGGFTGTFTFKLSGIRHDAPERSVATRIAPPSDSDQASRYLTGVMAQLAAGAMTSPHDLLAIKAHDGALPAGVAKLGTLEAVAFLGRTPLEIGQIDGDPYSVHIVEFAHGELLCGLHQRADGVLDALRCV